MSGSGFWFGLINTPGGTAFARNWFGIERSQSYRSASGDIRAIVPYMPVPGSAFDLAGQSLGLGGQTFGVINRCLDEPQSITTSSVLPDVQRQLAFDPGTRWGAIYVPPTASRPWTTYWDAVGLRNVGSLAAGPPLPRAGFHRSLLTTLATVFGELACGPQGNPLDLGDIVGSGGGAFVNFLRTGSNPALRGEARLTFGLARNERVRLCVYDVGGRRVRVVVDRVFMAGQTHTVLWDGRDQEGQIVRSGVYFYRLETPTWVGEKKLTLLAR